MSVHLKEQIQAQLQEALLKEQAPSEMHSGEETGNDQLGPMSWSLVFIGGVLLGVFCALLG
jgi:F0F1-type ATP synthase assembly protein I